MPNSLPSQLPSWNSLPENRIKINSDGSFSLASELASVGVLARSSSDSIVDGIGRLIRCSSPLVSEAWAVQEACLLVRARPGKRRSLKVIAKLLSDLCSSDLEPPGKLKALIVDIRTTSAPYDISLVFATMAVNRAAHWIATEVVRHRLPFD